MVKNELYNLLIQLTEELKSLWRIEKMYDEDSGDCTECQEFWDKMKKDKEEHVEELKGLIKKHL
ncbi:hypothetical protein GF354_00495 [Candidatus Peregrinibacteria bacterium]|nr:hypothetical protein [Candidatus Peregrinibacteria bacterium]